MCDDRGPYSHSHCGHSGVIHIKYRIFLISRRISILRFGARLRRQLDDVASFAWHSTLIPDVDGGQGTGASWGVIEAAQFALWNNISFILFLAPFVFFFLFCFCFIFIFIIIIFLLGHKALVRAAGSIVWGGCTASSAARVLYRVRGAGCCPVSFVRWHKAVNQSSFA